MELLLVLRCVIIFTEYPTMYRLFETSNGRVPCDAIVEDYDFKVAS